MAGAEFRPVEEPEESEYNEGWRFWVMVFSAGALGGVAVSIAAMALGMVL